VDLPADTRIRKVSTAGVIALDKVFYKLGVDHAFQQVLAVNDGDQIIITDLDGEALAEHTRPAPGVTYVGHADAQEPTARTLKCHRSPDTTSVTDVLMRNCHRCAETSHGLGPEGGPSTLSDSPFPLSTGSTDPSRQAASSAQLREGGLQAPRQRRSGR
jgi:hypothetical protein